MARFSGRLVTGSRFGGRRVTYYNTDQGPASVSTRADGSLWLSTEGGFSGPLDRFGNARPVFAAQPSQTTQGDGSMAAPRTRNLRDRFMSTAADAAYSNPLMALGRLAAGGDPIRQTDPQTGQVIEFPSFGQQARQQERARRDSYQLETAADPWTNAPGGVVGRAAAGASALGGVLAGSMADPTNLVGGGGRTLAGRVIGEAAVNAAGDAAAQGADVTSGVQDRYSPMQTALAAGTGALIQGGMEVAPRLGGAVVDGVRRANRFGGRPVGEVAPSAAPAPAPAAAMAAPPAQRARPARLAPAPIQAAINDAADASGVSSNYLTRLAEAESGFRPDARAGTSSATGLYQFTEGTWLATLERHGRALGVPPGGDRQARLALRNDPALSARAAALLTQDNARALTEVLGRAPTDGELYSAHFLGEGGARQMARADAGARAADLFPEAAAANRSIFFDGSRPRTVGEIRDRFNVRFGGETSGAGGMGGGRPAFDPAASASDAGQFRQQYAPAREATPLEPLQPLQPLNGRPDYAAIIQAEQAGQNLPETRAPLSTDRAPEVNDTVARALDGFESFPPLPGEQAAPMTRLGSISSFEAGAAYPPLAGDRLPSARTTYSAGAAPHFSERPLAIDLTLDAPDLNARIAQAPGDFAGLRALPGGDGPSMTRLAPQDNPLGSGLEGFRVDIPETRGQLFGTITGEVRPDQTWRVRQAELPEAARGQGRAVQAYVTAAREADAAGARLTSDSEVTPAAARVWQGLERRGFVVERNPLAQEVSRAGIPDTMGMGPVSIRTPDDSPVFRIAAVPPRSPRFAGRPVVEQAATQPRTGGDFPSVLAMQSSGPRFQGRPVSAEVSAPNAYEPTLRMAPEITGQAPAGSLSAPMTAPSPSPRFSGRPVSGAPGVGPRFGGQRLAVDLSAYGDRLGETAAPSISGLREAPRPGAVPRGTEAAYGGQTVSGLARDLRTALGLTHRQGRQQMKRAEGEYDLNTAVVRTKAVQELDVLAHEATHALEFKRNTPALQAALQANARELEPMAYPGAAPGVRRQEGFAEFGRWYLTNPDYARKVAPGFYDAFEAALRSDAPDVADKLRSIQGAYQQLLRSDSIEVAKASVAYTGRDTPLGELAREVRERGPATTIGRLADSFYTAFLDAQHPLNMAVRRLAEVYRENAGKVLELRRAQDPYSLSRLAREAYAAGHGDIVFGVTPYRGLDPEGPALSQALETAEIATSRGKMKLDALKEFDAYLIARRAIHEWDRFSRGELPRPPDRNTRQFHEQVIADAEAAHPTWADAAQQVYGWLGNMWRKRFEAGLITEETYKGGLTNHPDYVPFQRDVSDKGVPMGRRGGAMQFAGGSRAFEGSTRDILSPLSTMMRQSYELNAIIRKNDVLLALDDLAERAGPGSGAVVERLPAQETEAVNISAAEALRKTADELGLTGRDLADVDKLADDAGDTMLTLFRKGTFSPRKGETVVFVWRGGKAQPLLLADGQFGQEMFEAITGMSRDQQSLLVDMAAAPTQLLRYGVTLSPEFQVANVIRDQIATFINTDVGYRPGFDALRGAASELTQDAWVKRYATAGGMRGGANVAATQRPFPRNDAEATAQLQHLRTKGLKVRRFLSWRGLAEATDLSETSTRLGVFRRSFEKAKRQGLGDYEALIEAGFTSRDYLDFGRRGSKMVAAARLVTFLNAALQGLDKTTRVLGAEGNLIRAIRPLFDQTAAPLTPAQRASVVHAGKAWAKVSALGALGLGLRMLYADDPEYQEIGDPLRATNWIFRLNGEWVFVPKPFELATLSNIMERGYEGLAMRDPTAPERLLSDLAHTVAPPADAPLVAIPFQIARNRSSLGVPIVPDHLRGTVDPSQQFNAYTSQLAKLIGRTFNLSPAVIDHVITGFGGTLGRYALQGTNLAYETATGAPRTAAGPEDTFLVRRFVRDVNRGSTSQAGFWDEVSRDGGDMSQALGTFRQIVSQGKDGQATGYLNQLDPATRGFVRASFFTQDGSSRLHPMVRATESLGVIGDLRRSVRDGSLMDLRGQTIQLTPEQRGAADDALAEMANVEMRNAMIATGVKGWAQRQPIDHGSVEARLERVSPVVAEALRTAWAVNRVPPEQAVLDVWPRLKPTMEAPLSPDAAVPLLRVHRARSGLPGRLLEAQRALARQREGQ